MSKKQDTMNLSHLEALHSSGAGYDILRYISLPELLGEEKNTLLYFMGKNLARKFEIHTIDDIYSLFDQLGWGKLELIKQKRKEFTFHLMSDDIVLRLKAPFVTDFRLEAGFLSEALYIVEGKECECVEDINHRIHQIEFSVVFTD